MSVPRGIDVDVWGPAQERVINSLIDECVYMRACVMSGGEALDAGAGIARNDFSGFFSDLFNDNTVVRQTDCAHLADAFFRVSTGLKSAKEAAQAEQRRIDKARAWQKEHDEWVEERNRGPIRGSLHDFFYSEPEIPEDAATPGEAPVIQPPVEYPGRRENPAPGSAVGATRVSSARPDNLDRFVSAVGQVRGDFTAPLARVKEAYTAFEAGWTWKSSGNITISGMDALLNACEVYDRANGDDAHWIGLISQAFRRAGQGDGVVALSDQALLLVLQDAQVVRTGVDIPPLGFAGMVPTTGYADDPINTATGNFVEPEVDLGFTGANSDLVLSRMFNSVLAVAQRNDEDKNLLGVFGPGWWSVVDQKLIVDDTSVTWVRDDGRHIIFPIDAPIRGVKDGQSWQARYTHYWISALNVDRCDCPTGEDIPRAGRMWIVSDNQGQRWIFTGDGAWLSHGVGAMDVLSVERNGEGLVDCISHRRGRSIRFTYRDGQLTEANASDGRKVRYVYDSHGRLCRVETSRGSRLYSWDENNLIDKVVDASGVVECINTYDDKGRVTTQCSAYGRVSRFAYLPGNITVVSDEDGKRSNTWISDAYGRTVGIIDSDDQRQSMSYDKNGNLVQVRDREGNVTVNLYDSRCRVTRCVLPTGGEINYEWDEHDRLTCLRGSNDEVMVYEYDNNDRYPSRIIDACGGVTRLLWNDELLEQVVDPTGVTNHFSYDDFGDLIAVINANGDALSLVRDDAGRVTEVISPLGYVTTYSYDDAGNMIMRKDPDGAHWRFAYDLSGRVVKIIDPYEAAMSVVYGAHGEVIKIIDPLGRVTSSSCDDLGNLASVTLPNGATYSFMHDGLSRLKQVTDPTGGVWAYTYSKNGVLTGVRDPSGAVDTMSINGKDVTIYDHSGQIEETVTFDLYGRPVSTVDASGDRETLTYDLCGRPIEIIDAAGAVTTIERDLAGKVIAVVSPQGSRTRYTYDACGRLESLTSPSEGKSTFIYDADSHLVERINATGEKSTYEYDPMGRLTHAWVAGVGRIQQEYDKCGRVIHSIDPVNGKRNFSYDQAGQLVQATNGMGGCTTYEYDECGRVISTTDPHGISAYCTYDYLNRVTSVTDPLGRIVAITYDKAGRRITRTSPDGAELTFKCDAKGSGYSTYDNNRLLSRVQYDPVNRNITIDDHTDPHQVKPVRHILGYDHWGQLTSKTTIASDFDSQKKTAYWTYGKNGQLTSHVTDTGHAITYGYNSKDQLETITHDTLGQVHLGHDEAGRLVSMSTPYGTNKWTYRDGFIASHTSPQGDTTRITRDTWGRIITYTTNDEHYVYQYDSSNSLTQATGHKCQSMWMYDICGRLTRAEICTPQGMSTTSHFYDDASQLVRTVDETQWGTIAVTHDYTSLGQRACSRSTDGSTTTYEWDSRGWLARTVQSVGEETIATDTHVDALGCLATVDSSELQWNLATSPPMLTGIENQAFLPLPGGATLGLIADNVASWRGIGTHTDPSNPYVTAYHTANFPSGSQNGTFDLPSYMSMTPEGGLSIRGIIWMTARLYDPVTASFLTKDPLSPPPAAIWEHNPYNYGANNPLNLTDPYGLKPITDTSLLTIYNNNRNQSFWEKYGDNIMSWEFFLGAGLLALGSAFMFTGVGAAFGSPLVASVLGGGLLGAGTTMMTQKGTTGEVEWRSVGVSALTGMIPGGGYHFAKVMSGRGGMKGFSMAFGVNAGAGGLSSTVSYTFSSHEKTAQGYVSSFVSGGLSGGITGVSEPVGGTIATKFFRAKANGWQARLSSSVNDFFAGSLGSITESNLNGEDLSLQQTLVSGGSNTITSGITGWKVQGQHGVSTLKQASFFGVRSFKGLRGRNGRRLVKSAIADGVLGGIADYAQREWLG